MENIKRITETLQKGEYISNPHQCAFDLQILSGEMSWICGQLELILQRKAEVWNKLRPTVKSDTATERLYEQTEDGINEIGLKLRMKGIGHMMSTLRTLIKMSELEAKNLH